MSTYTEIQYGLVDVTAKPDSVLSCNDKQPFVNIQELKLNNTIVKKSATLELNQFSLDGMMELFPENPHNENWGLWSLSMSDKFGKFETPIELIISFTENHSSQGLTLYFMPETNDFCNDLNIKYYDGDNGLILSKDINPNAAVYFAEGKAEDYRKIVITFNGTNKPYRYLKLSEIKYGAVKLFSRDEVIEATLLEEVDITSSELSINTLDFKVYSSEFSLLDPKGIYSLLQKKQDVTVTEFIDGKKRNMGTFYLDAPESASDDTVSMSCIDAIGVMDQTSFKGGLYNNKLAKDLITEIMISAGFTFILDSSFDTTTVTGWLPICTHREALQQVAFAIGAIVDCSRAEAVRIYPVPTLVTKSISKDMKQQGHSVKQKSLVTGVEVTAHKYVASTESSELYKGVLPAGNHEIVFSEPKHSFTLTGTGAKILEEHCNYCILNVTANSEVTLSGKNYSDAMNKVAVYMPELPANEKKNILTVEDATLISESNSNAVAQRLYDYYQRRIEDTGEMFFTDEETGTIVTMESMSNKSIKGYIESLEINLTGGYIGTMKITGEAI